MDTALAFQAGYQGSIPQYNYNFLILSFSFKVWWLSKPQPLTGHSAYVATSTKSNGVKIDGFFYPNFM